MATSLRRRELDVPRPRPCSGAAVSRSFVTLVSEPVFPPSQSVSHVDDVRAGWQAPPHLPLHGNGARSLSRTGTPLAPRRRQRWAVALSRERGVLRAARAATGTVPPSFRHREQAPLARRAVGRRRRRRRMCPAPSSCLPAAVAAVPALRPRPQPRRRHRCCPPTQRHGRRLQASPQMPQSRDVAPCWLFAHW